MQRILKGCLATLLMGALMVAFFVIGFVANAAVAGTLTAPGAMAAGNASVAEVPANFHIFYEALGLLRDNFYGELPQGQQVPYAAVRGVLGRLGDPNTILVEPAAHEREQEQFQGEFGGIGVELVADEAGQVVIVAPIADTPAARADLRANDILLEIDGRATMGMALDEATELLRGEVGTQVKLRLQRPEEPEPFEVTLTREKIPDPTVEHSLVEGSAIGYIRMTFFSARTPDEVRDAITDLQAQGATRFILDLRNNPGGRLDAAVNTASLFVGEGVVAYQQQRDGTRANEEATGEPLLPDAPLLVLINEGSASASEILAGALQAYDRARLVGTTSYGKGTVQVPYTLSDGSSLHVTVAHWLTPDGIDLSSKGLTPEIVVETTEAQRQAGEDPVYQQAIDLLKETN